MEGDVCTPVRDEGDSDKPGMLSQRLCASTVFRSRRLGE